MRLSSIGLIGGALLIGAVSAAPAFAKPASISGSTTFITPAGFTSTVSGESVLPAGFFYNSGASTLTAASLPGAANPTKASLTVGSEGVIVLPQFTLQGFSVAAESLQVASGGAVAALPAGTPSFSAAAAKVLTDSAAATAGANVATEGRNTGATYFSGNIEFITAIIKAGAGVNGLD